MVDMKTRIIMLRRRVVQSLKDLYQDLRDIVVGLQRLVVGSWKRVKKFLHDAPHFAKRLWFHMKLRFVARFVLKHGLQFSDLDEERWKSLATRNI